MMRNAGRIVVAMLYCTSLVALFHPTHISAQNARITGRVTDVTGTPLAGANIILRGSVLGAAADVQGRFSIDNIRPGTVVLVCSMIGYRSVTRTLSLVSGDTVAVSLVLEESAISTGEVVVTASKHAQSFEEVPVSVSMLKAEEIESRGITRLDNALRQIGGVNVAEDQVNIRGSSGYSRALGSRVLLLMDGVPVLAGDAGEIKFDAIPMYSVERIEVVKGAGSALYGSSALGGVINIITKEVASTIARARVIGGLWDSPRHEQWKWWGDSPRINTGLDAQYGDTDGRLSYLITGGIHRDQGFRKTDDYLQWNTGGRVWYRLSTERNFAASMTYSSNDRGNWIFWRNLNNALVPPEDRDLTERVHSTKFLASAQYRTTHSSRFASTLRMSAYRTSFDTRSDISDFSFRPSDRVQSTAWQSQAEWQGTLAMSNLQLLTFGMEVSNVQVDSRTYGQRRAYSGALYVQNEIALTEGWHLSAGGRFDITAVDTLDADMQVNPRFGATYNLADGVIARASYGWGFRAPSVGERFAAAAGGGLITKPNPLLKAERSTSYEVGIKHHLPWRGMLDVAVFRNDYTNLVEATIDPADGRIVFRNITEARILGYEISAQTLPWEIFDVAISYTYMFPRDLGTNSILKYRPRHLLYVSGTWNIGAWGLGVDNRYISRMEEIDAELSEVIPDADRRVPIHVTDVRVSWSGRVSGLPLRLTALLGNAFNYHYTEVVANVAPIREFRFMLETGIGE